MYCEKCGRKLDLGTGKCRNCGALTTNVEYCGGFWGLVGEPVPYASEKGKTIEAVDLKTNQSDSRPVQKKMKKHRWLEKILLAVCGMLFVLVVILSVRIFAVSENVSESEEKYGELKNQYSQILEKEGRTQEEIDGLRMEHDSLREEIDLLQTEIDLLKTEVALMKEKENVIKNDERASVWEVITN